MRRDELRAQLERAGISPRRSAGQNFLVEENLVDAIARDGEVGPEDVVLEVGVGPGILTRRLVAQAHHVVGVELDHRVAALARELLGDPPNLTLVEADALASKNQLNPEVLAAVRQRLGEQRRLRIVANLPYSVATPLVVLLLAEPLPLDQMVVMVQLEVAERFAAEPGQPQYGAVSVLCAALAEEVRLLRRVPPDVFMPRPKVTSAVVRFRPRPDRHQGFEALSEVVRGLFNYRRKTLLKAARLAGRAHPERGWLEQAVTGSGLDPGSRVDELDLASFRRLAEASPTVRK